MPAAASSWILSEGYAGLQAQALGLAEAAGLQPEMRVLAPRAPWKWLAASLWPAPLAAVADAVRAPLPELVIGCGGMAAAVGAALRRGGQRVVQVQHPRMDPRRFDLIVVNRHDELTGPNVLVTRTALHRVTPARLAAEAAVWRPRLPTSSARWSPCWSAAAMGGSGWTPRSAANWPATLPRWCAATASASP